MERLVSPMIGLDASGARIVGARMAEMNSITFISLKMPIIMSLDTSFTKWSPRAMAGEQREQDNKTDHHPYQECG